MSAPSPESLGDKASLSIFGGGVGHLALLLKRELGTGVDHGVGKGLLLRVLAALVVVLVVPLLLVCVELNGQVEHKESSKDVVTRE